MSKDDFLFVNDIDEDTINLKPLGVQRSPIYMLAVLAFVIVLAKAIMR